MSAGYHNAFPLIEGRDDETLSPSRHERQLVAILECNVRLTGACHCWLVRECGGRKNCWAPWRFTIRTVIEKAGERALFDPSARILQISRYKRNLRGAIMHTPEGEKQIHTLDGLHLACDILTLCAS